MIPGNAGDALYSIVESISFPIWKLSSGAPILGVWPALTTRGSTV